METTLHPIELDPEVSRFLQESHRGYWLEQPCDDEVTYRTPEDAVAEAKDFRQDAITTFLLDGDLEAAAMAASHEFVIHAELPGGDECPVLVVGPYGVREWDDV